MGFRKNPSDVSGCGVSKVLERVSNALQEVRRDLQSLFSIGFRGLSRVLKGFQRLSDAFKNARKGFQSVFAVLRSNVVAFQGRFWEFQGVSRA